MGIYAPDASGAEKRVGYVHLLSKPDTQDGKTGTRYSMVFRLATRMLSVPTELLLNGNAWVLDDEGLSTFKFHAQSFGEHIMEAQGKVTDGRLNVQVETAGETIPVSFPIGNDLLLRGNFGAATLNLPTLEIGDDVLIDAFDPVTMTKGKARVACVGMETLTYEDREITTKILETELGGITTKTWVTLDEQVMRIETPVGLVLRRISQREAMEDLETTEVQEVIHAVAVHPTGRTPFRGARRMTIRLSNVPPGATVPADAIQREIGAGEFRITSPDPPDDAPAIAELEAGGSNLAGDPFIQVGHDRIQRQADAIVGDETDSWQAARAIYRWVYENVDKVPVLSFPSALDVLASRQGDCNEHTVLYAALARSAGIPTRVAVGLVWSDELGGFYYHAWPEVNVGGWVPVDPTLGQPVADATHIKLLEGSVDHWPRLVPYLGQLNIEVVDVE